MTLATGYTMSTEPPALDEYLRLRAQSGLTPRTPAQGAGAIGASLSWRTVREDATGEAVAMGRMIGDGTWYFHICDMATLPAHQRRGLGRTILDDLVAHIRATAPDDPYITLFADEPGRPLYRSAGFTDAAPRSVGMVLK